MLRVLRLPELDVTMLPDSFGGLIHLRYLDLSESEKLEKIPNSICKLHHLQTLNLTSCWSLVELPSNIGKLVSLRHLLLRGCWKLYSLPSGLAEITTLVTLDRLTVHHRDGGLRYFARLDDLCGVVKIELPVKGWSNCIEDATNSKMFKKKKLKGMIISSARGEHELTKEEAGAVVEALRPHENLEYLNIERYIGDKLWVFSLSNLKQLILKDCPNLEYLDHPFESVFPCLELLEMELLPNLKGWWREVVAPEENDCMSLSRVSKVSISYCQKLVGSVPSIGGSIEDLRLRLVDGKLLSKLFSRPNLGCSSNCHPYSKLKRIYIGWVQDLNCLPENLMKCFSLFSALKSLEIEDCSELRWVSVRGLAHLTALEELEISDCGYVKLEDANEEIQAGMPWRALQRLRKLKVPWQRHLQGGLQYLTALQVLKIDNDGSEQADVEDRWVSVSGLAHLTALEELEISVCGSVKLEDANEEIQVGMPCRYLQRLRKLKVPWHRHLQGGLQYLTVLEELEIGYYESGQVEADNEDVQVRGALWTGLDNLQTLKIHYSGISRQREHSRVEVPKWIQYLPSVKDLTFYRCKELSMSWTILANMKLLRKVTFFSVEKVVNVNVDEMVTEQQTISNSLLNLTIRHSKNESRICTGKKNASWINDVPWKLFPSLQKLKIKWCSEEVGKRCEPESGEDWPLISHIPTINISWADNGGNWQAIHIRP